jgi:C4-type Zn-finger protein
MTIPDHAPDARAAKYLEECAPWCPVCGTDLSACRPVKPPERLTPPDSRPVVDLEWQCDQCHHRWTERFTLAAVLWVESRNVLVGAKA